MKTLRKVILIALLPLTSSVLAQTYCDYHYKELQDHALAARYEQLPAEQKSYFIAQLPSDQRSKLMGMESGHRLGAAINNSLGGTSRESMTDVFNKKLDEFKPKCGFMLK
jgi:hypothetical protein